MVNDRWVEVTPSQFAHEAEGLRIAKRLMPDRAPYRAWTNFEFRDDRGNWAEVDLLVLAPDGLHLIELKYYSGRLQGTDQTWRRDGRAPEDSPLLLANRKAKRLRSKLMTAYGEWLRNHSFRDAPNPRDGIPFIQEAVFLHHPDLVCALPDSARIGLYGLPDDDRPGALDPITDVFDGDPRPNTRIYENAVVGAMQLIGVRAHPREAGSFVLDPQPLDDGPGWQDWLATHKHLRNQRRRIRFRTVPEGSSEQARSQARLLAAHELQVMQRLSHDAILRPEDYVDSELGPGLVYPYDSSWQRLDLWLAGRPDGLDFDTQLDLVRQIAEALQYAHGKNVVHRRLSPHAVLISTTHDGRPLVRLTDWQGVGRTDAATSTQATRGVTALASLDADQLPVAERWIHDGFTAPEGVLAATRNRLRLDVFGLGALAFYLFTGGQPPARTAADLKSRLHDQDGLDLSVELPAAHSELRRAVLAATAPSVSERLPDVAAFLSILDAAVQPAVAEVTDPLDAGPGAILGDRFELTHRLGAGSTAVGLLVRDHQHPDEAERVLKVAVDDAAVRRLEEEADTLGRLNSPRIAKLIEGPLDVGGRWALLLASAGQETLATHLGNRDRLSLDLLERWGTDLLETVIALDSAGVMHRDIKPANLGVREARAGNSNRAKHLMLFDFSLSKAPASDTQAGTRPYLDPFLGGRRLYDSAAERYAAAVVLFEMATGHTPVYGDGLSEPAAIRDEATIDPDDFDASARARLAAFFTRALARDATARHHTADEMLLEWRACFPESSVVPANADELAANATADTPLAQSGLTPRAISALEPLAVSTVGELAAVDAVRLNRLPGSAVATRDEIKRFAKLWRSKFARSARGWRPVEQQATLPGPHECADLLLDAARTGRNDKAVVLASHLLGVTGSLDANATQAELAASFAPPVTRGRVSQLFGVLQDRWATVESARELLDGLADAVDVRLGELGGVATFDELAKHLLGLMVPAADNADAQQVRLAEGMLRCTIERRAALDRAEAPDEQDDGGWFQRRREHQPVLVATRHDLLDVAEALGRRADQLVAEVNLTGTDALVPAARVTAALAAVMDDATTARTASPFDGAPDGPRLARLAARLSTCAGASATGELHHRDLGAAEALRQVLPAVVPGQPHTARNLQQRVRSRFPDLPPLPRRTDLDRIVIEAGLGLQWDPARDAYLVPDATIRDTTGLDSRPATMVTGPVSTVGPGAVGQRLRDSRERRSFLALGVGALRLEKFLNVLRDRFDAVELDLSGALMDALADTAAAAGISWADVLSADTQAESSRPGQGLRALVKRSLPAVGAAVRQALDDAAGRPVALVDGSLLARYDALDLLAGWMDLATARPAAVWLVVPQLPGNTGAMVDGRSLPLTAPSQYVPVPPDWIDAQQQEGRV
ncbi:BREX system serine/threonine kinase PglW [Micropruina sonneratiae]|uniref:BREX system serine/threonine kinase PglW n=1 Tax=Micropruina sonneratiae TaxID=2986940 RepID=UPI002226FAD3|nr:BREX system serine/threonine kinase PglW [Micropruina sp. KQZ13P-5]MCW3158008.1 BREX system serine/threonine kinase PglW [Micropruina sp. KQZ13P-5]MCW3158570.1 BREX system serine/threonine kinase PglW [Micropruina sp. KQZ13P-5]